MGKTKKHYVIEDLSIQESWRLFKIMSEFVDGFDTLQDLGPAVSIFGSARVPRGAPLYVETEEIASRFAQAGFAVISGGGPGLMEAANKGAFEAQGKAVGLNIQLPHEQKANPFQTTACDFHYFFVRKVMFVKYAKAYVVMPGGIGTLDELFEAFVLTQTERIPPMPIALYGEEYWGGLVDWLRKTLVANEFMGINDMDLIRVCNTPKEVVDYVKNNVTL